MKRILYFVLLLLPCLAFTQEKKQFEGLMDSLFAEFNNEYTPGFAIGVVKDGKMAYAKGYGMASLNYAIPVTRETIFPVASLSKQFTASCIAILVLEKKISLEDDIRKYLPDFPFLGEIIRVKHLVYHMSGLNDYPESIISAGSDLQGYYSYDDVRDLVYSQKELLFKPGEKFQYNNSGYVLLADIVEKVSGLSLDDFARKRIFDPLGMNNTRFVNNPSLPVRGKAVGYTKTADGEYMEFDINTPCVGSGNLLISLDDMLLWEMNFHDNKIFPKGYKNLISQKPLFHDGKESPYTFGIEFETYNGQETLLHGGSVNAYKCRNVRFPSQKVSVVVLANSFFLCDWLENEELTEQVASLFMSENTTVDLKPLKFTEYPAETITTDFTGKYVLNDRSLWVYKKRNKYYITFNNSTNHYPLLPVNDSTCVDEEAMGDFYRFRKNQNGEVVSLNCPYIGRFEKRDNAFDAAVINRFSGLYYSEEINSVYRIFADKGKLFCKINNKAAIELARVGENDLKLENMHVEGSGGNDIIDALKVTGELNGNHAFKRISF